MRKQAGRLAENYISVSRYVLCSASVLLHRSPEFEHKQLFDRHDVTNGDPIAVQLRT